MNPTGNWGIRFPGMNNEAFVAEVAKELDELLMWEAIMCEQEQRELAQLYHDRPPMKCVDGIGPQVLAITPTAYIHYKAIEGLDFSNPKDLKYLINRHPHMRVQAPQRVKTGVGYTGPANMRPSSPIPSHSGKREDGKTGLFAPARGGIRSTTKFAVN